MSEVTKSYYAIIPANVRYDKELKDKAKLLYGEITALCNERGYCWATNNYFAELYGVSKETISRLVSNLANKGYIRVEIIYEGKQIVERRLYITPDVVIQKSIPVDEKINTPPIDNLVNTPHDKIVNTPIDENVKENTTKTFNTKSLNQSINQDELSITKDDEVDEMDYEKVVAENIDYENLKDTCPKEQVEGIFDLIVDTLYSTKKTLTVDKENMPIERIKKRLLKLNSDHVAYVINSISNVVVPINKINSYTLTCLYNAPTTIGIFYANQANQIAEKIRQADG